MQSLSWYAARLARMSPAEIAHRSGKALQLALRRAGLGKVGRIGAPALSREGAHWIAPGPGIDVAACLAAADRVLDGRFDLFHLRDHPLGFPPDWNRDALSGTAAPLHDGRLLDYRDERLVGNIKYLWEPSRHLELVTLAQAWALSRQPRYIEGARRYLSSWLSDCPYPCGPHWSSSLELGIRLINWSIAWQLFGGAHGELFADAGGAQLRERWLQSVYQHAMDTHSHLSRFSSANNHLIGEATGVWIAATTWPYWPELERAGTHCKSILETEMQRQNAPDGGNREQAFSYQQFVADFLLLAGLAGRAAGSDFSAGYWQRLEAMLRFIAAMLDVAGNMPMVGDADDGYVTRLCPAPSFRPFTSLVASGALLFDDPEMARKAGVPDDKVRWLAGPGCDSRFAALRARAVGPVEPRRAFAESGYYLLGSDFDTQEEVRLLLDAGPLGYLSIAAHGHADALSLQLNVGGHEVLVDPGTYSYHTEPDWRAYFRGTRAHNTVEIDGLDQSVQRGNFMWTSHAQARCLRFEPAASPAVFAGEQRGYQRLPDPVLHEREVRHTRLGPGRHEITVIDRLRCKGRHQAARHWHFAENLAVVPHGDIWHTRAGAHAVTIRPLESVTATRLVTAGTAAEGGWISRSFGHREPAPTLRWENLIEGDTELRTLIEVTRD